jgi:hypothetical protein
MGVMAMEQGHEITWPGDYA